MPNCGAETETQGPVTPAHPVFGTSAKSRLTTEIFDYSPLVKYFPLKIQGGIRKQYYILML